VPNIVSLDEARRHLRFPAADTADDASLALFIDAADDVMRKETGDNVPILYDESHDGGDKFIFTYHKPVLSVENVEEGWGFQNYELDFVEVNSPPGQTGIFSYSIDNSETGMISRRTAGNINTRFLKGVSNIRITYTAGRNPIPPVIRLATLELIAHWWQNSQQRTTGNSGAYSYDSVSEDLSRSGPFAGTISPYYGVPMRIIEMVKAFHAEPIIG
jgi:hypothetical protein